MIQFNLLPDVKQEYIKAKKLKRSVIVISLLVAAASLFLFVMMFLTVKVFQTKHISDINKDIEASTKTLQETTDLNKILTIQNQLRSLPSLHDKKPVTSRLFTFLSQMTPAQTTIGSSMLDFEKSTVSITGNADSLGTVNKFIDTIKFTTYANAGEQNSTKKPFTNVVLSTFSRTDKDATFTIDFSFDKAIFSGSQDVTLSVPKIISTRSETEKPADLFKAIPETTKPQ